MVERECHGGPYYHSDKDVWVRKKCSQVDIESVDAAPGTERLACESDGDDRVDVDGGGGGDGDEEEHYDDDGDDGGGLALILMVPSSRGGVIHSR